MRANRRTDTKPELALRRALHKLGYRYRKDYRVDLDAGRRVRPDIVFTSRKVAVFVDGCFWHACPEHGTKPKNNEWYWSPKLRRNAERDQLNTAALTDAGWQVVRLWEHVTLEDAVKAVITAVGPSRATAGVADSDPSAWAEVVGGTRSASAEVVSGRTDARVRAVDAAGLGRGVAGRADPGRPGVRGDARAP